MGNVLFFWLQQPKTMASICFPTGLNVLWSDVSHTGLEPESWQEGRRGGRRGG